MIFNKSLKYDFMPDLRTDENLDPIEVVKEMKLLGVTLSSDLNWHQHVSNICKKAYLSLWMLRRLKKLGATSDMLLDLYAKHVRCNLEYATPAWNPGLTQSDVIDLERVQKCALSVIFSEKSYTKKLKMSKLDTLADRREKICKKFALKTSKNNRFEHWFVKKNPARNTRQKTDNFTVPPSRCKRYENSPFPYLTRILNTVA